MNKLLTALLVTAGIALTTPAAKAEDVTATCPDSIDLTNIKSEWKLLESFGDHIRKLKAAGVLKDFTLKLDKDVAAEPGKCHYNLALKADYPLVLKLDHSQKLEKEALSAPAK